MTVNGHCEEPLAATRQSTAVFFVYRWKTAVDPRVVPTALLRMTEKPAPYAETYYCHSERNEVKRGNPPFSHIP